MNDIKLSLNTSIEEAIPLEDRIKNNGAFYFVRCTPFTAHGEFNYNGCLKPKFFYKHLFSEKGNYSLYLNQIIDRLCFDPPKTILLNGNQGCGKTTFVNQLERLISDANFHMLDFDRNTSNTSLSEYIEILSSYLHVKINEDFSSGNRINTTFFNIYETNINLILRVINGRNNIEEFFCEFEKLYIVRESKKSFNSFINNINKLFFNQILSLIMLWHIAEFTVNNKIEKHIFCFDNLDVLINEEIVKGFFREYFLFVRNVDDIIQGLNNKYINGVELCYPVCFSCILSMRNTTWAKVLSEYMHQENVLRTSTLRLDLTDAFDKNAILEKRYQYIYNNRNYYAEFAEEVNHVKMLLNDMKDWHNIYDLFNDDYRQCSVTFDEIVQDEPNLVDEYIDLIHDKKLRYKNGAKGIIYKALWDKFRDDNIFKTIGVADVNDENSAISDARIILDYLDYHTYLPPYAQKGRRRYVSYGQMCTDFKGILEENTISSTLTNMFKLGISSLWNELIGFEQIGNDISNITDVTNIYITKAGHEYLDLISTHFEFFNSRIPYHDRAYSDYPLFSNKSLGKIKDDDGSEIYIFEKIIKNVYNIVNNCCIKMSDYYSTFMFPRFGNKSKYLNSHFVYKKGHKKFFHGERILHTHIRYLDHFRLYCLSKTIDSEEKKAINQKLIAFIEQYISSGEENENILSHISETDLFPVFKSKIKIIKESNFEDFTTEINIEKEKNSI